jgi:hypothetical protein
MGHYPVKNIVGKGLYEVQLSELTANEKKGSSSVIFQVLNHLPLAQPAVRLSIHSITLMQSAFRASYRYYFVVEQENIIKDIW